MTALEIAVYKIEMATGLKVAKFYDFDSSKCYDNSQASEVFLYVHLSQFGKNINVDIIENDSEHFRQHRHARINFTATPKNIYKIMDEFNKAKENRVF